MKIILIGGSEILTKFIAALDKKNINSFIITSTRQSEELVDDISLGKYLQLSKNFFLILDDFDDKKVKKFIGNIDDCIIISIASAWIFNTKQIEGLFKNKIFNIHPGLLPINRGSGGFSWQILMGSRIISSTIHKLSPKIDEGEVVSSGSFLIPKGCCTPIQIWKKYTSFAIEMLLDFLTLISRHGLENLPSHRQENTSSTYWPRLSTQKNGWIDWSWDGDKLDRFISAFSDPYQGAKTILNKKIVSIKKCQFDPSLNNVHPFQYGMIYQKNTNWFLVSCKLGTLIIESIRDADENDIFNDIRLGDRFITPYEKLLESKERVFFGPKGLKS